MKIILIFFKGFTFSIRLQLEYDNLKSS